MFVQCCSRSAPQQQQRFVRQNKAVKDSSSSRLPRPAEGQLRWSSVEFYSITAPAQRADPSARTPDDDGGGDDLH